MIEAMKHVLQPWLLRTVCFSYFVLGLGASASAVRADHRAIHSGTSANLLNSSSPPTRTWRKPADRQIDLTFLRTQGLSPASPNRLPDGFQDPLAGLQRCFLLSARSPNLRQFDCSDGGPFKTRTFDGDNCPGRDDRKATMVIHPSGCEGAVQSADQFQKTRIPCQ